jgi:hypothetical protein
MHIYPAFPQNADTECTEIFGLDTGDPGAGWGRGMENDTRDGSNWIRARMPVQAVGPQTRNKTDANPAWRLTHLPDV